MTEWPHLLRQVSLQGEGTHSEERPCGREAETAARRLQALGHLQPQNRAETRTRLPLTACRRDQPSRHLTSRLGPPEPWKATFLLFPATYLVGTAAMGRESSVPTPRCTSAQAGKRGPREPGPCEPCFSLQSAHSELPKRHSPSPAGCAAASWIPQGCWAAGGVTCPGSHLGRCVSPRAPRPQCLREQTPPRSWTLPTSLPSLQGMHPQDRGSLGPGLRLSHREAGGPAERSPVIPLSAQGGEVFLGGCPCSLPACSSEGLPLMACAPAGLESVPPTFLGSTQSSRCFHGRTQGLLSTEAGTGVLLRTRESLRDTDSESGSSWSDL